MPVDIDLLSELQLFELLNEEDRIDLAEVVDYVRLAAGDTLFEAGDPGDSLFIVRSGEIELFIKDRAGQKIVLTVAGHDDLFGELSLLNSGRRTATAVALSDCELIMLDEGDLHLLFQKKPEAAIHMLAAMTAMLRAADDLLRTRVSRNVNAEVEERLTIVERVADWIAWFSGSMYFLGINAIWFGGWIGVNTLDIGINHFDP